MGDDNAGSQPRGSYTMSMLERDLQDVNLETVDEADEDAVEDVTDEAEEVEEAEDETQAFEKALGEATE